MKIIPPVKSKGRKFWLIISLLIAGFLGWEVFIVPDDYPTSKEFINPATGKPEPEMATFVLPLVNEYDNTVSIDMGSVPGDVIKMGVLQYLSPVIRMHPKARYCNVTWDISYPNYHVNFTLKYDRHRGVVTEEQNSLSDSSNPTDIAILGKDITDRHIHEGACGYKDYDVWAREHWHR